MPSRETTRPVLRATLRMDIARGVVLAVLAALIWCTVYDRWTAETWAVPITYVGDNEKTDALYVLAQVRAARDGHLWPWSYTTVPELGAPFIGIWADFPVTEKPVYCLAGLLAQVIGIFAAANVMVMLGHILAALAFYAACRLLGATWIWSFAGALIFAFSRYAFSHGLHHLAIAYDWPVPLALVICLWSFRGEGIAFGEWRFRLALVVAFVTGVHLIYYTWMFAQFLVFAAFIQSWRRGWRAALPALAIIGTAVAAVLLMNASTFFYSLAHGQNGDTVVRTYRGLEAYALKIVDLVVPPPDHRFPPFAAWSQAHIHEMILPAGEMPPSGYLGLVGLAAFAWLVVGSWRRFLGEGRLPLEAWLVLWILLYAGVGGLNGVLGVFGFEMIRSTARYSIFVLCLVLLDAVRVLSAAKWRNRWLAPGLAVLAVVLALWDQVPPLVSPSDIAETARAVASDRDFTADMERRLPAGAMVFQWPITVYPESLDFVRIPPYDHFRPYLYSKHLRFSFGSDKGRPPDKWQQDLTQVSPDVLVDQLERNGFSALYLYLNADRAFDRVLLTSLRSTGHGEVFQSEKGDLLYVVLKPTSPPAPSAHL